MSASRLRASVWSCKIDAEMGSMVYVGSIPPSDMTVMFWCNRGKSLVGGSRRMPLTKGCETPVDLRLKSSELLTETLRLLAILLQQNSDSHQSKHHRLQPRVFAQHDCDVSYSRHIPPDTPYDVLFPIQVFLSACVELGVISDIVVALCKKLFGCRMCNSPASSC
jgi:hypothetical protein